jgi:hypothetical protein
MKHEIGEEHVSMLLRSLPPRVPPSGLRTSLRVIASKERQRLIQGHGLRQNLSVPGWIATRDSFQNCCVPWLSRPPAEFSPLWFSSACGWFPPIRFALNHGRYSH